MVEHVPERSGNGSATLTIGGEEGQAAPARAVDTTVRTADSVAGAAQLACVLEVAAEKPGNITPSHDFDDTSYEDMLRCAIAAGPELARAGERGVGETVLAVVEASRRVAPANTNLGIALLLAPLAKAALEDGPLRPQLAATLHALDVADGRAAYRAIRFAGAGGLLAAGGMVTAAGRRTLRDFDASLRGPGNTLNPGTTADLVTATLFVAVVEGMLSRRRTA